jgi:uncharacterized protein YbcV (DUF1398 family)
MISSRLTGTTSMQTPTCDGDAIARCARDSLAGSRPFPAVVAELSEAGVGSYYADYRAGQTVYYPRSGDAVPMPLPTRGTPIAPAFDAPALQAAIKGAQRGVVVYPEFLALSMAAGCVGYHVWIDGRHVTYLGARGEVHVERFPGAN